ncbi:MAG: hypothetical protein ABFS35_04280 [Bacteroidota bacterium]
MIKLYWIFYKSLFLINLGFSLAISIVVASFFFIASPENSLGSFVQILTLITVIVFLTGGLLLSLGYHELYKKKLYSFFHNHAITRVQLFLSALFINTVIGITLLILVYYA